MRPEPPLELLDLLDRLSLAKADDVRGAYGHARRLAKDLPLFQSVWVDALAQARILTPFQAAEINAGRGEQLQIGPYVLCGPLPSPGYIDCYLARELDSARSVRVVTGKLKDRDAKALASQLDQLVEQSKRLADNCLVAWESCGLERSHVWVAGDNPIGSTAADWMAHNGRLPPEAVLEIARQMASGLAAAEQGGLIHGDLCAIGLLLSAEGQVTLPHVGLRAILRPAEGFAHADLRPEAYDYLAPERIGDGTPPTTASDLFACGLLWWHLLSGRAPLAGGNSLAKIRSAQSPKIIDIRRLAPDTPEPLAVAISACLQREPRNRPESFARLAMSLGPSTRQGKLAIARAITRQGGLQNRLVYTSRVAKSSARAPVWTAAVAGCLVALAGITWPLWRSTLPLPTAAIGSAKRTQIDRQLQPKHRLEQTAATTAALPKSAEVSNNSTDLVLPNDRVLDLDRLELKPGQIVRGENGRRPVVRTPTGGLAITGDGVRIENVDFVLRPPTHGQAAAAAMIELISAAMEFQGCTFRCDGASALSPVAILWSNTTAESSESAPSGRLKLTNCIFDGVKTGVDCDPPAAVLVELKQTLYCGPGPLVRIDGCRKPDEPLVISLERSTIRGATGLVEYRYQGLAQQPGTVSIAARDSVFALAKDGALVAFHGSQHPELLLRWIEWTGQGSLLTPEGAVAAWQEPEGQFKRLSDDAVPMAGLVRSQIKFASAANEGRSASCVVRWQGPLQSDEPPGISENASRNEAARHSDPGSQTSTSAVRDDR